MLKDFIKNLIGVGTKNEATRVLWIEQTLKKIPAGITILDAGAGEQQFKKFCSHLKYVSQDFAEYDGKGDGAGLQTKTWDNSNLDIISDIVNIPRPDGSFDAIMCTEVFEHIANPVLAIKEFSRLLKPGGFLLITSPFCSITHFAPYHFYSGFNRYFYQTHLPSSGFEILDLQSNGNFFEYVAQEIIRIPFMAKRYTNKRLYPWDYFLAFLMLLLLKRLNKGDQNSAELLNFGFHVFAVKK